MPPFAPMFRPMFRPFVRAWGGVRGFYHRHIHPHFCRFCGGVHRGPHLARGMWGRMAPPGPRWY